MKNLNKEIEKEQEVKKEQEEEKITKTPEKVLALEYTFDGDNMNQTGKKPMSFSF